MQRFGHRYVAEILLEEGRSITTPALAIDWVPAIEWAHFQGVRRGAAGLASVPGSVRIAPCWDAQSGRPYVASIEMSPRRGDPAVREEIPLRYLASAVRHAVSTLIEEGRVVEGAKYTWRICAYDAETSAEDASRGTVFAVEDAPEVADGAAKQPLAELTRNAVLHGPARGHGAPSDFPVFISQRVLEETATAAIAAGDLEAGGVLLGRVSRDVDSAEPIVEVTAQIPAREAIADDASLRFTPTTWQAVHAAIALRRGNERIVGWHHSHPRKVWPCHACPAERRAKCPSNCAFFSAQDVGFHRTAFQGAANVALLLSFHADPAPRFDLFGWRQGLIAARDYYVVPEKPHAP